MKMSKRIEEMAPLQHCKPMRKPLGMKIDFLDQDMPQEGLLDLEMPVVHKDLDLLQGLLYLDLMLPVDMEVHKVQ